MSSALACVVGPLVEPRHEVHIALVFLLIVLVLAVIGVPAAS